MRVKAISTYTPNASETFQCIIVLDAFPDAIDEAMRQSVRGVHEMLRDSIEQDQFAKALDREMEAEE